jgi:hypothetical protein
MTDQENLFTPGDRFQWFIVQCYGSVYSYAEKFGFNASQVYRTINNASSPRLETLVAYALTGLNLHWMSTGNGPWWSPDDVGRELARKKGVVFTEKGDGSESIATDYAALVRTIFEMVEESVIEKLGQRHEANDLGTKKKPHTRSNRKR